MNLKSSIFRIFSANFLSMISGIVIGFIVPAILSIEDYSYVKTYAFYISYIGFLHFGFIDGVYIKYGGKDINDIDIGVLKYEHKLFIIIQSIVTIIFLLVSFISKDLITFLMALSIIPINISSFHKLFYQATGQFKLYAKISYIYTIIYLLLNILLAFVFRSSNYILYCLTTLLSNIIIFLFLESYFFNNTKGIKIQYDSKVWNNMKVGFFILIGNLSVMLFYALDRWFIKIFFDINAFAYYSFAISMLNIINLLISAISITFYNYLSKDEDKEKIKKLKNYFLILGGFASLGYFALAAIISLFLKKYIPSLSIIAISFSAYPYMIIINALYVNLYKARKDEKRYVKVVFSMVIISAVYNILAIVLCKKFESIALATTLSFITWYAYSIKDFKYLKPNKKEIIYLSVLFVGFLIFSNGFNWFIGGLGYLFIMIIMDIFIFKEELIDVIKIFQKFKILNK